MRIFTFFASILCVIGLSAQELTDAQIKALTKKPENLRGEIMEKGGKQIIHLTWGEEPHDDIAELEYIIFTNGFGTEMAYLGSIDIRRNSYDHPAPNRFGQLYKFQVQAEYEKGYSFEQSPRSDTLEVYVPTRKLPELYTISSTRNEDKVTLSWKYSDRIDDLAGFKVYDNERLIATEKEVPREAREWTSEALAPGKHVFKIKAVTRYDVSSGPSRPRTYTIEEN